MSLLTKRIRKTKVNRVLITFVLIAIVVIFFVSLPKLASIMLNEVVISPGFEGAKCYAYGAEFRFNPDWTGTYKLHRYQDAEDPLVSHSSQVAWITVSDKIYWASVATPNDVLIGWQYMEKGIFLTDIKEHPLLGIHVESNIQLQDINRRGDPIGWNITNPTSGQRIEYWSRKVVKEETADKVIYHYKVTKETFVVAPSEFWIGFYLVPSQENAKTASGWREGDWSNIVVWFMLDFTTWDNAYKDAWLDDPEINVFTSEHDGRIINKQKSSDYRGGFPIVGWIQGWEKAGWEKSAWEDGRMSNFAAKAESPVWFQTRSKERNLYTADELADLKDKLMAKCSFSPGLIGQFLSLYNQPSDKFEYEVIPDNTDYSADALASNVKTPDSRMKKTMYFPINILNFGTYADGDFWNGWRIFYPSVYFRIRILYGVYGTFTYLWTEELARSPTVQYPTEPELHGTTVINTPGILQTWFGWTSWFANPFNQLLLFFILLIAVIVIVTIFNPGIWTAVAVSLRKGGK